MPILKLPFALDDEPIYVYAVKFGVTYYSKKVIGLYRYRRSALAAINVHKRAMLAKIQAELDFNGATLPMRIAVARMNIMYQWEIEPMELHP